MFKIRIALSLAVTLGIFSSFATAASASPNPAAPEREFFWTNYWSGEYPTNFRVMKSVKVPARSAPESQSSHDLQCSFKKGLKLGPQQKFAADYYTRFQVENFRAKADTSIDHYFSSTEPPAKIAIKAGEIVQDLAYLAEGFCRVRTSQGVFESACFGNLGGDEAATFEPLNPAQEGEQRWQEWMSLKCGRKTAWVLLQDLQPLFDNGTLSSLPPAF